MSIDATCFKGCMFYKKKDKCPFRVKTTWVEEKSNETKSIWDCAPKRSLMMQMNWDQRLIGVQQATEQNRNVTHKLVSILGTMVKDSEDIKKLEE